VQTAATLVSQTSSDNSGANSELLRQLETFSDRIGRFGNADNQWFDSTVNYWTGKDGKRIPGLELSDIGHKLVEWAASPAMDIRGIAGDTLREVERVLLESFGTEIDGQGMTMEVLGSLRTSLREIRDQDVRRWHEIGDRLLAMMGDATKMLWLPLYYE
jgi:hypothetical protein